MILLLLFFTLMMHTSTVVATRIEPRPLPYPYEALDPYISAETLRLHHDKHYVGYVNKLNELILGTPFEGRPLEEIIMESDGPIFNNAAQIWNHEFYFDQFSPAPQHRPSGPLMAAIDEQFGSFEKFQTAMNEAAVSLFGSGWVWLVVGREGKLEILSTRNAGTPMRHDVYPLICFDVWEHAYYVDYQNRRLDAVRSTWPLIDWKRAEQRYLNRE